MLWNTLIGVIPLGGKNGQQIQGAIQKQIKTYQKLMEAFTTTSRAEQALINHVQARQPSLYSASMAVEPPRISEANAVCCDYISSHIGSTLRTSKRRTVMRMAQ